MSEHLKYLQHLRGAAPSPHKGTDVITAHVKQRLSELNAIRMAAGERGRLNVTAMVKEAATATLDLNADHVASVVASWRQGSAAAHGFHWAPLGGHDARQPTPEELATPTGAAENAELAPHSSGGSMVDLAENYLAAVSYTHLSPETRARRSPTRGAD